MASTGLFQSLLGFLGISRRRPRPSENVGYTGAHVFGGYLDHGETRGELIGTARYRTFSNILVNTSIVGAGVRYFLGLVGRASWTFSPADDSAEAKRIAEAMEQVILKGTKTPWHRVVRRAAMFRFYGFSLQEWRAKRVEDGFLGLYDIAPRPQRTIEQWDQDDAGDVIGAAQRSPLTGDVVYLPTWKCLYLCDDALSDNPEGLGIFRQLVDPASRLAEYELMEHIGYDADLRGIPVGRAPLSTLARMKRDAGGQLPEGFEDRLLQPIKNFIKRRKKNPELGIILDSEPYRTSDEKATPTGIRQYDIDLLNHSSTGEEAIAGAIQRINREMARLIGVESLLLGDSSTGSFALAKEKTEQFILMVESTLKEIVDAVEAGPVAGVMKMNGWDPKLTPELTVNTLRFRDPTVIAESIERVAKAGATLKNGDKAMDQVFEELGLEPPEPLDEEDLAIRVRREVQEAEDRASDDPGDDAGREMESEGTGSETDE